MADFGWAFVKGNLVTGSAPPSGAVQFNDGNNKFAASGDLVFISGSTSQLNLTGTLNVSGAINANEYNVTVTNQNVINLSATGSTKFGDSTDDTHVFTGSLNISNSINPIVVHGLQAGTGIDQDSYLALNSSNQLILTSAAGAGGGSGGAIGDAEDGDYTDGLFTDFLTTTPVGTPIDRFNEVLKILAPSPAPALSRINSDNTAGSTVKLSFGSSNVLSDYSSSNTQAGFDAIDVSGTYQNSTSGSNFRLGAYKNDTDVTGFLNFNVVESSTNGNISYSHDAFSNAETGSLKLELNGTVIHTLDLSSFTGAGNPNSGSANSLTGDSGFTNVSVTASSFDGNASEWYIFKHRTCKFKVDVNEMSPGWNYVRAIHTIGSTDYATNYVEWINDPSGSTNDLSVSNARIENISLVGSKFLSGVEYNTDLTASYKVDINNLYRNVYQASGTPISFTTTNSTTPADQSVEDIDTSAGEDHTKVLGITASLDCDQNSLLNGAVTANITVQHPFKSTISNTGSATTGNGFLIDNRTLASTNTQENFHDETYRKTSGDYNTQNDTIAAASTWNSENHMTGGGASGHTDGLLFFDQRLYSPTDGDIPNGGDFSTISNIEAGNPDYSGITSGTRTFYRIVSNSSGADLYNLRINTNKVGTTFDNNTLQTANARFSIKVPGSTGWMDISQNYVYDDTNDTDGALIPGASNDVDSGNNTHNVTFGTQYVPDGERIMVKIEADASWEGYISQIDFTLPANQSQATPQSLSDIDAAEFGSTAVLSFGASSSLGGYTNVSGTGSLVEYDLNEAYQYTGDSSNLRGVFTSLATVNGTLNDAIGAGSGYPADAFHDAYSGSLILEVNGVDVHTVDLTSTTNSLINNVNSSGSGFDLSELKFSTLSNIPHYVKNYRTGSYKVGAGDQRLGWNFVRIKHGSNISNYVQWVVDTSSSVNDAAVSSPTLNDFGHTDVYYQSGIGYFASNPTSSFSFSGSNFYTNVYQNGTGVQFPTKTRISVTSMTGSGTGLVTRTTQDDNMDMPLLNGNSGCQLTDLLITASVVYNGSTPSISGAYSGLTAYDSRISGRILHPFKTDNPTSTSIKSGFMVYSGSLGSTRLQDTERFGLETYRIVSGNYANQSAVTASENSWDSSVSVNDTSSYANYASGLVTTSAFLLSPKKIGNAGDTRSDSEGSTGLQAPSSNPNYSTLDVRDRDYYRMFRNESLSLSQRPTITLYGDANIVSKSTSLDTNKNIHVEIKVPYDPSQSNHKHTGWCDVGSPFDDTQDLTVDGAGLYSGTLTSTVDADGTTVNLNFQAKGIYQNQYFIVKISAHENWTGYITRIDVGYG